jgi:hypothetical protein
LARTSGTEAQTSVTRCDNRRHTRRPDRVLVTPLARPNCGTASPDLSSTDESLVKKNVKEQLKKRTHERLTLVSHIQHAAQWQTKFHSLDDMGDGPQLKIGGLAASRHKGTSLEESWSKTAEKPPSPATTVNNPRTGKPQYI